MYRITTLAGIPLMALAMAFSPGAERQADAGGFGFSVGSYGRGFGYSSYRGYRPSYGYGSSRVYRPNYRYPSYRSYSSPRYYPQSSYYRPSFFRSSKRFR